MQNKLQELTDKLYKEGLSKGKSEGEQILAQAKAQAEKIVADAKSEAAKIVAKAENDAAAVTAKAESDIRTASAQALQATKKDIENILLGAVVKEQAAAALAEADVVKQMILAAGKGFNSQEAVDLEIVLPEALKSSIEPWLSSELAKALKGSVKASFSKKVSGGFTIGPADGSYFVSLTDDTFTELITEYLRPVTKKILFGK